MVRGSGLLLAGGQLCLIVLSPADALASLTGALQFVSCPGRPLKPA